jgi:hypothetical protein
LVVDLVLVLVVELLELAVRAVVLFNLEQLDKELLVKETMAVRVIKAVAVVVVLAQLVAVVQHHKV